MNKMVTALVMLFLGTPAQAHDMFLGTIDPIHGWGCCSGYSDTSTPDCKIVPKEMLDAGVVKEIPTGYHIELTVEQARFFESTTTKPVIEDVEWKRVIPGLSQGFAICVHNNTLYCLFGPSNT